MPADPDDSEAAAAEMFRAFTGAAVEMGVAIGAVMEYDRVPWAQVNARARAGWRLFPVPPSMAGYVMERPLPPAAELGHLLEEDPDGGA